MCGDFFGEYWIVTDEFLKEKYWNSLEKDLDSLAQIIWTDITGEPEPY